MVPNISYMNINRADNFTSTLSLKFDWSGKQVSSQTVDIDNTGISSWWDCQHFVLIQKLFNLRGHSWESGELFPVQITNYWQFLKQDMSLTRWQHLTMWVLGLNIVRFLTMRYYRDISETIPIQYRDTLSRIMTVLNCRISIFFLFFVFFRKIYNARTSVQNSFMFLGPMIFHFKKEQILFCNITNSVSFLFQLLI
jgi:hypothetical protein